MPLRSYDLPGAGIERVEVPMQEQPTHCMCGCGTPLDTAKYRKPSRGGIARFVRGHQSRGRKINKGPMRSAPDRFWEKVDQSGECWLWLSKNRDKFGYGRFYVHGSRTTFAHRWSYEQAYGPIPDGLKVLHKCDTPGCVRPDHLFLGTILDNIRDMDQKGRRNVARSLSAADVVEIRRLYDPQKRNGGDLARRFGVTRIYLWKVVTRRHWPDVL